MKNFIVPVDFSVESLNGLKMAILFSKRNNGQHSNDLCIAKSH